jgi:hypothetical protein
MDHQSYIELLGKDAQERIRAYFVAQGNGHQTPPPSGDDRIIVCLYEMYACNRNRHTEIMGVLTMPLWKSLLRWLSKRVPRG